MKIDLQYLLNKKRIDLQYFCKLNNLSSYTSLKEYCLKKNFICVEEKFYNDVFPAKIIEEKHENKIEVLSDAASKKEKQDKPKRRRSSTTSKTRKGRATNTKNKT